MKTILVCALAALVSATAMAGEPYSYTGTTESKVMGTEETKENMVLNVEETDEGISFSMYGYSILEYEDVSITGTATIDADGNITGWDKIVIKGAPAKVKKIEGQLGESTASLHMTGKAAGVFNFDIKYNATRN